MSDPPASLTLLAPVAAGSGKEAIRIGDSALTYAELRDAAAGVAAALEPGQRVALWCEPSPATAIGLVGAIGAGATAIPLNPKLGVRERAHVIGDSAPTALVAPADAELPEDVAALPRVPLGRRGGPFADDAAAEAPALILYTSGTTGPPKGAVLPRGALAANLDALATAWNWTAGDRLVHGLPLFHVHGLVLGMLGPLRLGGHVEHLGRFSAAAAARALTDGATLLFGVPTMYHRLAQEGERDPAIGAGLRRARLLVSGSAALPVPDHAAIERLSGQRIVERYGMTETLMSTAVRAGDDRRPGYVGPPLPNVELRLLDDAGNPLDVADDETIGEIAVRGPSLFSGYLNRPDATSAAMRDGWFVTGDLATRAADGAIRIVGRRATDLIKSGGYRIGAGEIEFALLDHPHVDEVAVTGEPDPDLGERIVAWVVAGGERPAASELIDHVAEQLTPHKRPRVVRFVETLPRNELGKIQKSRLTATG